MSDSSFDSSTPGGRQPGSVPGTGFKLLNLIFPVVVFGGMFLGAGILWTNRYQFCRQFPDAPLICAVGTRATGPTCGEPCDEGVCHPSLACVGGVCVSPPGEDSCNLGCYDWCASDADCGEGFTCALDSTTGGLGQCVGAACPLSQCIAGDGVCDPACAEDRIAALGDDIFCGENGGSLFCCPTSLSPTSGAVSCFIGRDNDCLVPSTYVPPPSVCGGHCDPSRGWGCAEGLDCVEQYIYGGVCLGAACDLGCYTVCRTDDECGAGLTCEHDPAAPGALGYCVGATCPENHPCINGDGTCDPTCEQARLAAITINIPVCGYRWEPDGTRLDTCSTYGPDGISTFISRDSDCPLPVTPIPPSGGGGGENEPVTTEQPSDSGASSTLCASPEQGGVAWQGTFCSCDGLETNISTCANGQQVVGAPTGNTCPAPADCAQPPGGGTGSQPGGPGDPQPTQCCIFFETEWYCGAQYCP